MGKGLEAKRQQAGEVHGVREWAWENGRTLRSKS